MYKAEIGNCVNCEKESRCSAYKYCDSCSLILNKCGICGDEIKFDKEECITILEKKIQDTERSLTNSDAISHIRYSKDLDIFTKLLEGIKSDTLRSLEAVKYSQSPI
jgi:hypothetical protein